MTRPIYEPSLQRTDARLGYGSAQLFRRPAPGGSEVLPVFRAGMAPTADPENDRVHFLSDDDADSVYWDRWDTSFDSTIFDTGPYEQTVLGIPVISGVGLLQLGVYSIHALVDFDDFWNGIGTLGTNYDEGIGNPIAQGQVGISGEPFFGDSILVVDQWRQVVDVPPPDSVWGGEATDVQITFAFSSTTAMPSVSPGKKLTASTVDPGADMWIPGGYDGAYGKVPNMLVVYWGPSDGDPDWPAFITT